MNELIALGWGPTFSTQLEDFDDLDHVYRVVAEDPKGFDLTGAGVPSDTSRRAVALRNVRTGGGDPLERLTVGDWVVARPQEAGGRDDHSLPLLVSQRLERRSCLVRGAAGTGNTPQILGANIDVVFVVTSMNQEFNARRIERHLSAVHEAGAEPVIVLNKMDLADDPEHFIAAARAVAGDSAVAAVSAMTRDGLPVVADFLGNGKTVALIGSSGVGKSTLTNALLGEERQVTASIRNSDHEGRHTTTSRQLIPLPDERGLLLDMPGIRELRLWTGHAAVDATFEEIQLLAQNCRFRDCAHNAEPGCAVQVAVAAGTLDVERLQSYFKLQREVTALARRHDVVAKREHARNFAKVVKEVKRVKGGAKPSRFNRSD